MTLSIILNKPSGRKWWTSFDDVCGTVVLVNKTRMAISAVTLLLQCKEKASIRPINATQGGGFDYEEHMLLSRQVDLFKCSPDGARKQCEVIEPGRYSFPFSLEMPVFTSCHNGKTQNGAHAESELPPSFQLTSLRLQVSIKYYLRAIVRRPSFLKRNLKAIQPLAFRPIQPPDLFECQERAPSVIVRERLSFSIEPKLPDAGDQLPPYIPSAAFEVAVPSPNIIRPGDRVNFAAVVTVPRTIQNSAGVIWLRDLTIRIRTTTTARVDYHEVSHVSYVNVCHVHGFLLLKFPEASEKMTLPADLWNYQIYPFMLPSFVSCGIRRTDRLEIAAGFSTETSGQIHAVLTDVEVTIKSGPSAVTAADVE